MHYNYYDLSDPFKELISLAEAAELWKVEESTIRKAIANGYLKDGQDCRKFGKQWVITAEAMKNYRGNWDPWARYKANCRKEEREN